jgi:hypothetical protein
MILAARASKGGASELRQLGRIYPAAGTNSGRLMNWLRQVGSRQ